MKIINTDGMTTEEGREAIRDKWEGIQKKRAILPAERLETLADIEIFFIDNQALLDDILEFDALIHRFVFAPYEQEGKPAPSAASVALVEARRIQQDALRENRRAIDAQSKLLNDIEEARRKENKPTVSIGAKGTNTILIPVDKVTRTMFNLGPVDGKEDFPIKVEKEGSEEKIDIPLTLDFSELQKVAPQIKELTTSDKRVLIVSDALYRAGNQIVTFDQIYRYTGHKGKLKSLSDEGKEEKERIDRSFSALNTEIVMDNQAEIDAGYNYPHAKLKGPILPNKRIMTTDETIQVNGKETDGVIRLLDKADIIDFAIDRGQVAEVPIEVYQTPFQKTDDQIALEDYFLTWLIRALDSKKSKDRVRKMSTIYREFNMTGKTEADRKRRERLREKIVALFDYYRKLELTVNEKQLDKIKMDDSLKLILKKVE